MTQTIEKTVEIAGVELELWTEYEATWTDFGIGPYEFWGATGCHTDYGWEIESVGDLEHADVHEAVVSELERNQFPKQNRRRWLKAVRRGVRQVERELATMSAEDVFSDDDIIEHANEHAPEPDYSEPEDYRE